MDDAKCVTMHEYRCHVCSSTQSESSKYNLTDYGLHCFCWTKSELNVFLFP